jgi:uncharacterized protein (DUF2141 family)
MDIAMSLKLPTVALMLAVVGNCALLPGLTAVAGNRSVVANKPAASPVVSPSTSSSPPPRVQATTNSTLNVEVAGLRDTRGNVCLSLYNSSNPALFPQEAQKAQESRCVRITGNPMMVSFKNLKPGSYAIALLHDANGNGKDDRNFVGMPTEGFGFSRNPTVKLKAPAFSEASVPVAGPATSIKINVTYLTNR